MATHHHGSMLCETCRARGERTIVPPGQRLCDACLRAHRARPDEPRDERVAWLEHEIANWQQGNIITARLARRILALYEPGARAAAPHHVRDQDEWPEVRIPMTPGMVLLYLGGILILTAVIIVASDVWKELGKEGRLAIVAVPVAALYGMGAYLFRLDMGRRVTGTVLLLFACLAAPAVFFLAVDLLLGGTGGGEAYVTVTAATLVLHAVTLAAFRSPVLTIPYPFSLIWLMGSVGDAVAPRSSEMAVWVAVLLGGLALMALAIVTRLQGKPSYAAMPDVVGTFTALFALTALGEGGHRAAWEAVAILACLAAIAASVFRKSQVYLVAGSLVLMVNILAVGFELFANAVGLPITLLVSGTLIILAGYAVQRVRHEYILQDT
jgi:hypothetical protein